MKGLREKFRKNDGFTLIEMLIVVAIIAILVAVSIPVVSNALERTRIATDAANERAAKAEIMVQYLTDPDFKTDGIYVYDAVNGTLETDVGTAPNKITAYGKCTKHDESYVWLQIDKDSGEVSMTWSKTKPADFTSSDVHGLSAEP